MDFESIIAKVDSLPPLSDAAIFVQQLYVEGAENVDIIKLVKIIESDALLAANILKMINAPIYGFSKKIASVPQAVSLFGTNMVYGLVISYALQEKIKANVEAYGISNKKFNDMCHLQSALMMQWYSRIDLRHSQFLTPLALMMESGKLILAKEIIDHSATQEFKEGLLSCDNIENYEHNFFGATSYFVCALLFEHWNLEPLYVDILDGLDYEDDNLNDQMKTYIQSLDIVRIAVNAKEMLTKESIEKACGAVEAMGLDSEYFRRVALRIKHSYIQKSIK